MMKKTTTVTVKIRLKAPSFQDSRITALRNTTFSLKTSGLEVGHRGPLQILSPHSQTNGHRGPGTRKQIQKIASSSGGGPG